MLVRPAYEPGGTLRAADLAAGQKYNYERLRRHNRLLHGWGVICGLLVAPANDPQRPRAVRICPGYAISPCGDEIWVPSAVIVDIQEYLWTGPPGPKIAYVAIRYFAEELDPVESPASRNCGCNEPVIHMSRLRDSWRIDVLWDAPGGSTRRHDLCSDALNPCPPPPASPYVVLARVDLTA